MRAEALKACPERSRRDEERKSRSETAKLALPENENIENIENIENDEKLIKN